MHTDPTAPLDDSRVTALHDAVDQAFDSEQIPWLSKLVETPSHSHAREDVEAAAKIFDATLERLGFDVSRYPDENGHYADHRVYRSAGLDSHERTLALVGHIDTVFPRKMGFLDFRRDEEKAYGPGVLDMKGGLSVIVGALRALKRAEPATFSSLRLRVVCVTDEEVGSTSSIHLYRELASRLTGGLVFEAGRVDDEIVTARKGTGTFTVHAEGIAAHAGNHHADGVNAIHALAHLIPRIEALTDYERGITVNVGLIEGGTSKNTVPPHAKCMIDVRVQRTRDADWISHEMRELVESPFPLDADVPERVHHAHFRLEGKVTRPPMEATPGAQSLRTCYETHAAAAGLKTGEAPRQGGGSDANLIAALGVPCIDGLGPFGKGFHSKGEWCSLESLRMRTKALACFLASECCEGAVESST